MANQRLQRPSNEKFSVEAIFFYSNLNYILQAYHKTHSLSRPTDFLQLFCIPFTLYYRHRRKCSSNTLQSQCQNEAPPNQRLHCLPQCSKSVLLNWHRQLSVYLWTVNYVNRSIAHWPQRRTRKLPLYRTLLNVAPRDHRTAHGRTCFTVNIKVTLQCVGPLATRRASEDAADNFLAGVGLRRGARCGASWLR